MRKHHLGVLLCLLLALPAAAAVAAEPALVDLRDQLQQSAQKRLFFDVPDEPTRYIVRDVEYWGTGFDEAGIAEAYPPDQWGAFELTGMEAGRTSVAALIELTDSAKQLLAFLEEGDVLTLTLTYKGRLEYTWTDVVLDQEEVREMVLMEVETLSYGLPRLDGYSTLWYDRRDPDRTFDRTHLSQDVLSRIARGIEPGGTQDLELAPGAIQVFFFPEIDARVLPLSVSGSFEGKVVFGVLSGRMGFIQADPGHCPAADDEGERVLEVTLPGDLAGRCVLAKRNQPSMTYFVVHVPQDQGATLKGTLVVGEPVAAPAPPAE